MTLAGGPTRRGDERHLLRRRRYGWNVADQEFAIRYSPRLSWLFEILLLGRRHAEIRLTPTELDVRMGWAFHARLPRSSIRSATPSRDVPWAIGVHTDLRSGWLVNGSATGIVQLTLDPPVRARSMEIAVTVKRLALGLQDPAGFLAALGEPATT
jgi:hypothetical protein